MGDQQVINNLQRIVEHRRVIVAYSGGVDSHVLLHLMSRVPCDSLMAVYINHGLSPHADLWEKHCSHVCEQLHISYQSIRINVIAKPRHSLEAVARDMRYDALSSLMHEQTVLLTGHNENDQAETVLLQLMRGAGIQGLSAMPAIKKFSVGYHARPLLTLSRSDIEAYASKYHLVWIEDESNAGTNFDRNFLRHHIMPELMTRREGVVRNITRSAAHVAETLLLMDDLARIDYAFVKSESLSSLCITALKRLSDARQSNVIRYWLRLQIPTIRAPSQAVLDQIKQQFLYSYPGAHPLLQHADCVFTRKSHYLVVTQNDTAGSL